LLTYFNEEYAHPVGFCDVAPNGVAI
jgi:hypothetical protein